MKRASVVAQLTAKKPDALVVSFDSENWDEGRFEELLTAQGLFVEKSLVLCSGLMMHPVAKEYLTKKLKDAGESENLFLFLEGVLTKEAQKPFTKHAEKVQEFTLPKTGEGGRPKKEFNIFSLTDAFAARDRRSLWVIYQKALAADLAPEEIFWKFVWQVKMMLLATRGAEALTAEATGINPYVFKKATQGAKNFKNEELADLSKLLTRLYHEARRGNGEVGNELERLILSL